MNIIYLILARKGSVRIKNKNLKKNTKQISCSTKYRIYKENIQN